MALCTYCNLAPEQGTPRRIETAVYMETGTISHPRTTTKQTTYEVQNASVKLVKSY